MCLKLFLDSVGKESPNDKRICVSEVCYLIQKAGDLVAVSSSNPAHTFKDVLTGVVCYGRI